ncbi:MAG TPA: hypothetical protein VNC61_14070, partial [Acidimicrobiales bacterium]|nr:hypothetical protein [Acidimicrobiales bacterium]
MGRIVLGAHLMVNVVAEVATPLAKLAQFEPPLVVDVEETFPTLGVTAPAPEAVQPLITPLNAVVWDPEVGPVDEIGVENLSTPLTLVQVTVPGEAALPLAKAAP